MDAAELQKWEIIQVDYATHKAATVVFFCSVDWCYWLFLVIEPLLVISNSAKYDMSTADGRKSNIIWELLQLIFVIARF